MGKSNYERLIELAEKVFAVKNDPHQLDVDQNVLARLQQIHPSSVMEYSLEEGPVAWVIVIPTTTGLMQDFLSGKISEKELYERTQPGEIYDCVYLCSALVLEEFRRKGIVKGLVIKALNDIWKQHPIKTLFVWPFTLEGEKLADNISMATSLPLLKRKIH